MLLGVVGIVPGHLPLVHCVEVETGIICLDRLEESPESILEATPSQWSAVQAMQGVERATWDRFATRGTPFRFFQRLP